MNRENKRKQFEKGYYKTHACEEVFTCKNCGSLMEPIAVWVRGKGEWAIIHRCRRCGELSSNRVLADDNPMKLMSIAMRPLANPPFPLERIEEMTALMGGEGELPREYRSRTEE